MHSSLYIKDAPVPRTAAATWSSPLFPITRFIPLVFCPPLLGLITGFVFPRGWWTTTTSRPLGGSPVVTPASRSFFIVLPLALVREIPLLLVLLLLRFPFTVGSRAWPPSGPASPTTIISVASVISSAVRWEDRRQNVLKFFSTR